jgi:uncharacterized protein
MRSKVHAITLAVGDLDAALRFYREGLGLTGTDGIVGAEWAGDDEHPAGRTVMFRLDDDLILSLYPSTELAKDAHLAHERVAGHGFSIGHFVDTREDVDATLAAAQAAGATVTGPAHERPWGIYSGYFADLDGHLWEVLCILEAG